VGVSTLAATLSEEEDAIEEMYEPYLMQIGMIDRTPRGRVATPHAYEYFNREQPRRQPASSKLFSHLTVVQPRLCHGRRLRILRPPVDPQNSFPLVSPGRLLVLSFS